MWQVQPGFYQHSLIDCFEHQGVLVKVHSVGSYPNVANENGIRDRDVPHIEILLQVECCNGTDYYLGAFIKTKQPVDAGGRCRELVAWEMTGDRTPGPEIYIERAKAKLDCAVQLLLGMDDVFEAGYARISEGAPYKVPFTAREDYEQACAQLNVPALTDQECLSYGVKYGVFSFPEYDPEFILKMKLACLRWRGLESLTPTLTSSTTTTPPKAGQLWEPCEHCGTEPCYLPLHLCHNCWPN